MARADLPKPVHRVKRMTKDGARFISTRGATGQKFRTDTSRHPTDPAFSVVYAEAVKRPKPDAYMAPHMLDDFFSSAKMPKGARTREDYRLWALRFCGCLQG